MLNAQRLIRPSRLTALLLGAVIVVVYLAPVCWIFSTSLRLAKDSFRWPPSFFPTAFHWESYAEVFNTIPFFTFLFNSFKVALIVALGQVVINSMMAFAFSRLQFKGRDVLFVFVLAGLMVSSQAAIIPLFLITKAINMTNTHVALILPMLMSPINVFMIKQSMMTIPASYEEAAEIDGANLWYRFTRIIVPMVKPAIALTTILAFMHSWNDYFKPLIFLSDNNKLTLPIGIQLLKSSKGASNLPCILAAVMMSMIPPLLVFLGAQKHIMKGLRAGGVKG